MIIVTVNDRGYTNKFRKKDGWQIGNDSYNKQFLKQPTKERCESMEIDRLKRKVTELRNKLSTPNDRATLEAMITALSPFIKDGGGA